MIPDYDPLANSTYKPDRFNVAWLMGSEGLNWSHRIGFAAVSLLLLFIDKLHTD